MLISVFIFQRDTTHTDHAECPVPSLQSKHTDDSLTWDFMAKRELGATVGEELQSAKGRASDIARREERCCQVYEEGLNSLNTGTYTQQTEMPTSTQVRQTHHITNTQVRHNTKLNTGRHNIMQVKTSTQIDTIQ